MSQQPDISLHYSASRGVPLYSSAFAGTYCAYTCSLARLSWNECLCFISIFYLSC